MPHKQNETGRPFGQPVLLYPVYTISFKRLYTRRKIIRQPIHGIDTGVLPFAA